MIRVKLFLGSVLITFLVVLGLLGLSRLKTTPRDRLPLVPVSKNLFITSQLNPDQIGALRRSGVSTLVDLRPDGEVAGEPSSSQMGTAAKKEGLDFYYIPVPHGQIPEDAVAALSSVLFRRSTRTVLYCHSGRRAVRTFALVEADRPDGPGTDAICEMVRGAGFTADDLRADISQRVLHRSTSAIVTGDGSTTPRK